MQLERLSKRHSLLFVAFLFLFLFAFVVKSLPISALRHESATLYGRSNIVNVVNNITGLHVPRTKETRVNRFGSHKRDDVFESKQKNERRGETGNFGSTSQPGQSSGNHPSTTPRGGSSTTPSKGANTNDGKGRNAGGGHPPLKVKKGSTKFRRE